MFSFMLEILDKPFQHPIIDPCFIGAVAYAADIAEQAVQAIPTAAAAWDQLIAAVLVALTTIVTGVGAYAIKLGRAWMQSKTASIKNNELRQAAVFAMERLDHIVTNVVKEIHQTRPTGEKLDAERARFYFDKALTNIKQQVTAETLEVVKTVVNDPERYFATKIEAAVAEQKACVPDIPAMVRAEIARLRAAAAPKVTP